MARRRGKPKTAFGAWLDAWLTTNAAWTLASFGAEVGVSKSAVSLWLSGDTIRIPIERLRKIAEVTGEPVENLEQLVYGRRPAAAAISPDLLDALEERMRRAFREELAAALADVPRREGLG